MATLILKRRGGFLVGTLAAAAICVFALFYTLRALDPIRKTQAQTREMAIAQLFATELLETFVSLSSDQLQNILTADPTLKLLNLCTYINMPNATNSATLNPLPIVNLPNGNPLDNQNVLSRRYFKIEVIDVKTLTPRTDVCAKLPSQIQLAGRSAISGAIVLTASETFKVTVGVLWKPKGENPSGPYKRVEMSATSLNL